ncbi:MAG: serine/threonine-protein kinase [Minicystis sp.]
MHSDVTRSYSEQEALLSKGALAPGTLAGDYVVTSLVARGGCGSVYRAKHRADDRDAAVKVLHASLAAQPKMVERFAREVHVVNLLKHPGIIEIYDVGSLPDGRPYYTMEYLSGRTLGRILQDRGRLPPDEVLALLDPVCEALEAAHAAGVVHRDVKASNIMVEDGPRPAVKLLDFGIAKLLFSQAENGGLTSEGRQIGTLTIMAPEQILGEPLDPRTDVYALGILLYRLLTGLHPFDARSPAALAQQHLEEPAPRPSDRVPLPLALDSIVLRCLEKPRDRRFPTVRAFLDALREAVGGVPRPQRTTGSYAATSGVAVFLEIQMRTEADDIDEVLSDDVGAVLDIGDELLRSHGFTMALQTGTRTPRRARPAPVPDPRHRAARLRHRGGRRPAPRGRQARGRRSPRPRQRLRPHGRDRGAHVRRAGGDRRRAGAGGSLGAARSHPRSLRHAGGRGGRLRRGGGRGPGRADARPLRVSGCARRAVSTASRECGADRRRPRARARMVAALARAHDP